jgi:hypothetical protein
VIADTVTPAESRPDRLIAVHSDRSEMFIANVAEELALRQECDARRSLHFAPSGAMTISRVSAFYRHFTPAE